MELPIKMTKIDKKKLTDIIYKRLNGALAKRIIYDALIIIGDSLIMSATMNKTFSIHNFGTFSPFLYNKHKGFNISSGKMQDIKPFKTLKFRPHANFQDLVEQKKDKLKDKQ